MSLYMHTWLTNIRRHLPRAASFSLAAAKAFFTEFKLSAWSRDCACGREHINTAEGVDKWYRGSDRINAAEGVYKWYCDSERINAAEGLEKWYCDSERINTAEGLDKW